MRNNIVQNEFAFLFAELMSSAMLIDPLAAIVNHDFWGSLEENSHILIRHLNHSASSFSARVEGNGLKYLSFLLADNILHLDTCSHEVLNEADFRSVALRFEMPRF